MSLFFHARIIESCKLESKNLTFSRTEQDFLGDGAFGKVYKGTYYDQGEHKIVAIKVLKKVDILNDEEFHRETSAMSCLNHENIIRFYGHCEINPAASEWSIIMEFANLGTLKDHFQDLIPPQASKACLDMYHGLQYLHNKDYVHRDMKLENILLVGDLNRDFMAKIGGLNLSREIAEIASDMTLNVGTPHYMAPELVREGLGYNYKVDVYSSTIIVFEVHTKNRFPFPSYFHIFELMREVRRSNKPPIPSNIPPTLHTLIARGWRKEPQERPEVDEFIEKFEELIETYSTMAYYWTAQSGTQNQAQTITPNIVEHR